MVRLENRPKNRFITFSSPHEGVLDKKCQELSDIIDAYGGTNPYPRFVKDNGVYSYSFTTKIATINVEEFDKEIEEWKNK